MDGGDCSASVVRAGMVLKHTVSAPETTNSPYWRPSVHVEPRLVLRQERPQHLGVLAADVVVVLGQVRKAPKAKLVGVVELRREGRKKEDMRFLRMPLRTIENHR